MSFDKRCQNIRSKERIRSFEAYLTMVDFVDKQMASCSFAATKAYLYLWRKTLGYQKRSASVSLDQLCKGTKSRRTGEIIDQGTGLHRETAARARRELQAKNLIARPASISTHGSKATVTVPTPEGAQKKLQKRTEKKNATTATREVGKSDPGPVGNSDIGQSENPTPKSSIYKTPKVSRYVGPEDAGHIGDEPTHTRTGFSAEQMKSLRDLLTRLLAQKLHQIPDDGVVEEVLRRLDGAPLEDLEERINLRYPSIASFGFVFKLAEDCATSNRLTSEIGSPPKKPMSKAEQFAQDYYRDRAATGSKNSL